MKNQRTTHYLVMAMIVGVFAFATLSCNKDDDPSLADLRQDKLEYLEDSLRISDSLKRINAAGIINYAVTVVDASNSSIYNEGDDDFDFNAGRSKATQDLVEGAIVTISQYGKTLTDTTDATGMVVFNGFFRNAASISIRKEGFTTVSYVAAVGISDATPNGSISSVGNIIPIFPTTGPNTATITGRVTIETNLTNRTPELVPDGTTVRASIDASDYYFYERFLTAGYGYYEEDEDVIGVSVFVGAILQATYSTGVIGTVTNGNYTITVPAAVDGLPLQLNYSDIAADQTLFQQTADDQFSVTKRVIFEGGNTSAAIIPPSNQVDVQFISFDVQATATAVISAEAGTVDRINVTNGGSGYIQATPPAVRINGNGTGATATATVGANGRVTGVTVTNAGTGYTGSITVDIVSGSGAGATATLAANGTLTSVVITNSGAGYTTAPTVTIAAPGGTGVTATATANIDGAGRVTSVTITNPGSGYTGDPAVSFTASPTGQNATAQGVYSGQSISTVSITGSGGVNYAYAPTVTFSTPERPNGVRATGTALIDAATGRVTGIQITNPGAGYTNTPTVALNAGSGATAQGYLTGGQVISFNITNEGNDYAYAPTVVIGRTDNGNGSGATGTAVMSNGRVVGINVTNGGSGYTSAPSVELVVGSGAEAYAVVNANGSITSYNVTRGGNGYNGAPRVFISNGTPPVPGAGATAVATVASGSVTAVTPVLTGGGYEAGNVPSTAQGFSSTKGASIETKPGLNYINDISYGTGTIRN